VKRSRAVLLLVAVVAAAAGGIFVWKTRGPRPVRIAGRTVATDGGRRAVVRSSGSRARRRGRGRHGRERRPSERAGEFSIEYQPHWKTLVPPDA
jgi:hypothetical protein